MSFAREPDGIIDSSPSQTCGVDYSRRGYETGRHRVRPRTTNGSRTVPRAPDDGVVRIFRERGNRSGKIVTVIRGLPERGSALGAIEEEELLEVYRNGAPGVRQVLDGAIKLARDGQRPVAVTVAGQKIS